MKRLWYRLFGAPKPEACRHPAIRLTEQSDTRDGILYACPCGVYIQIPSPLVRWYHFLRDQTPEVRNEMWNDRDFWEISQRHGLSVEYIPETTYQNQPREGFTMNLGEPNLSEVERKRSQGVAVLHYADGDYRCKWFTARYFTDDDDEMFDITADQVRMEYVDEFQQIMATMRLVPGEPMQAGFEVYWEGFLVHQELAPEYTPVPAEEEKCPGCGFSHQGSCPDPGQVYGQQPS